MKKTISLLMIAVLCVFSFSACSSEDIVNSINKVEKTSETEATEITDAPEITETQTTTTYTDETKKRDNSKQHVKIVVKNYGNIIVELDSDSAPETVKNFVKLVKDKFYDGLTFHRIIKGFMIQGGDPNGDGSGGSEETVKGEFSLNGVTNNLSHARGVISMARSSDYNSASSQFFICDNDDSASLDGQYAAFGWVIKGMDVVDKIADTQVEDSNGTVLVNNQPVITKIVMDD